MVCSSEYQDVAAYEHHKKLFKSWRPVMMSANLCDEICKMLKKFNVDGHPLGLIAPDKGFFHIIYRLSVAEGPRNTWPRLL